MADHSAAAASTQSYAGPRHQAARSSSGGVPADRGGDLAPASAAETATAVAAGAPEAATARAASPATAAGAQAAIAMVPVATAGAPAAVTEGGR